MTALVRLFAALVGLFALYSLRAWFVLGGAFFGVVLLRGAYGLAGVGDWPAAGFMAIMGTWLLVVSYRWFAARWGAGPADGAADAQRDVEADG